MRRHGLLGNRPPGPCALYGRPHTTVMSNAEHGTATILTTTKEQDMARLWRPVLEGLFQEMVQAGTKRSGRLTLAKARKGLAELDLILRRPVA